MLEWSPLPDALKKLVQYRERLRTGEFLIAESTTPQIHGWESQRLSIDNLEAFIRCSVRSHLCPF